MNHEKTLIGQEAASRQLILSAYINHLAKAAGQGNGEVSLLASLCTGRIKNQWVFPASRDRESREYLVGSRKAKPAVPAVIILGDSCLKRIIPGYGKRKSIVKESVL